jgi:hypothetical protein
VTDDATGKPDLEPHSISRSDLFLVPAIKDASALHLEGIAPHRIWTARELSMLLALSSVTPSDLQMLMVVRREFGGEIVELRPRGVSRRA